MKALDKICKKERIAYETDYKTEEYILIIHFEDEITT